MMAEDHRQTVVVIDDELGPRESLRILLKNDYNVVCTDSVDKGLEMLGQYPADVVVMDIRMPKKNGIEGLRQIRERHPTLAVILFTGFGTLETAQEAIRLGASDYVRKPFDTHEMQDIIRRNIQRTQLERWRQRAEKELTQLNTKLLDELAQKEKMAALGQQSVEFAHDLRNPLTAMLGYVTLLADELKDAKERLGEQWDETAEYLELIEKSVTRCKELSDLWLHRGKKGDQSRSAVPVRALLNDVILGICHAAEAKHVALELAPAAEDGTILANRVQVYRALQNIALNAVEAAPAHHGVVRLASRVDGDTLVITVADNGCGMDAAQIQRIFEPFYTTKKAAGTGLGLAIAKEAIDEHNGSIDVRSATQQGATFIIRLPLMKMGGALKAEGLALPGGTGLSAPHCTQ